MMIYNKQKKINCNDKIIHLNQYIKLFFPLLFFLLSFNFFKIRIHFINSYYIKSN